MPSVDPRNEGDTGAGFGGRPLTNELTRLEDISREESGTLDDRLRGELGLIRGMANREGEAKAISIAQRNAGRASDNDDAQFERSTRGMDLSARQKKSASRRLGLSRTLNRASAAGTTRRGFIDRSKAAKAVGGSFADAFFGQRVRGQTELASDFANKEGARIQKRADGQEDIIKNVGMVVGAFFSSEDLKHDHGHEPELLEKLKKVRVNRWQYKGDDKTHVGPFSEEFNKEFGIDTDRPDMISVIDALGVTMGAIKELDKKVEARG